MDKTELVISLRAKMFGDRGTDMQAAWDYAESIINNMDDSHNRGPAWTAIHVLANTIANVIETLPDPLAAPPAVVRISPADNPAAGASDLEAAIIRMIDARIVQSPALDILTEKFAVMITAAEARTADRIDEASVLVEGKVTEGIDDFIENQLDDAVQKCIDNSVDWTEIVRDELRNNITFSIEVD